MIRTAARNFVLLFSGVSFLMPASLWAQPGSMRGPGPGPMPGPSWHGPGRPDLPLGYLTLLVGSMLLFYHAGTYYRETPSGYVVVSPPVGTVITRLPPGYATLMLEGKTYYLYNNVYYQPGSGGYVVVNSPVVVAVPSPVSSAVLVLAVQLNVRSGPGLNHSVIGKLKQGEVLQVKGTIPGWYYVQLPDNSFGWVMQKFTTEAVAPPEG